MLRFNRLIQIKGAIDMEEYQIFFIDEEDVVHDVTVKGLNLDDCIREGEREIGSYASGNLEVQSTHLIKTFS